MEKHIHWENHLGETVTKSDVREIADRVVQLPLDKIKLFFKVWANDTIADFEAMQKDKQVAYTRIDIFQFECSIHKAREILDKLES